MMLVVVESAVGLNGSAAAELPNQLWQTDATHWALADGSAVEILNLIDDHSRLLLASAARRTVKAADAVAVFHQDVARAGYSAALLSDNAAVFSRSSRKGKVLLVRPRPVRPHRPAVHAERGLPRAMGEP